MRIGRWLQQGLAGALVLFALFGAAGRAEAQLKVMPLGDSITDGYNVPGGYRINLWGWFQALEWDVVFVGSQRNGPPELGSRDHEGHSGWRIDQISAQIDGWLNAYEPDIILLHIGTNDCAQNYQLATIRDRLSRLIDQITDRRPYSALFVATITPMSNPTLDERARAYNELIPGLILEKQKENRWVLPVDMYYAGVTLADGVHPDRAGYDVMADVWINAILGLFP